MRNRLTGTAVALAALLALAGLSRAPYAPAGADAALLRFSWRLNTTATENCRARTAAELAALPAHMRAPEVCTRDESTYSLITAIGDATPDTTILARGGARGDRPLFVMEEHELLPGEHRVGVQLVRESAATGRVVMAALDSVLVFERGGTTLVTLDGESQRLQVKTPAPPPVSRRGPAGRPRSR